MQLYIDANIYLEYFRENSTARLAPLRELIKLLEAKKVKLLIPNQTQEEYFRNKNHIAEQTRASLVKKQNEIKFVSPATLDESLKAVKDVKVNTEKLKKAYKDLIKKYDEAVEKEKTDAEVLIRRVFELGDNIGESEAIVKKAYSRYMKGNPPRKNDHSYGDAIIWETLLHNGKNEKLTIISKDKDFTGTFKGQPILNKFLLNEWSTKKKKNAELYRSLAEVVNKVNKKETIKKEIVQQEKEQTYSSALFSSIPYVSNDVSSLVFSQNSMQTSPWVLANSVANSFVTSAPLSLSLASVAFCPFCGKRSESVLFVGYHCTSCGRDFNV